MTALARVPAFMMRSSARWARCRFGGLAASQREQDEALVTMPSSGWLTSCAIDAVTSPRVVTRVT
jgi:hypothetical protein